jgi:hypothetical protein
LSGEVIIHEYDFGVYPQTGNHDAGERFRCRRCGATGDADDLVADEAAIRSPLGPRNGRRAAGMPMARCG